MDFLGREIGRRIFLHLRAVEGVPVGKVAGADRGPRLRIIFGRVEAEQVLVGRKHGSRDRIRRLLAKRRLLRRRNRRGHVLERLVKNVLVEIVIDEGRDRLVAAGEGRFRHGKAPGDPRAHVGDLLVEIARDLAHPGDVALVFGGIAKLVALVEIGPEAAVAVERHLPRPVLRLDQRIFEDGPEDGGVDLLVGGKLSRGNRVEPAEKVLEVRGLPKLRRRIDVGEVIGLFLLSVRGLEIATFLRRPGRIAVVERAKLDVRRAWGRCLGRGRLRQSCSRCQHRTREKQRPDSQTFRHSPLPLERNGSTSTGLHN